MKYKWTNLAIVSITVSLLCTTMVNCQDSEDEDDEESEETTTKVSKKPKGSTSTETPLNGILLGGFQLTNGTADNAAVINALVQMMLKDANGEKSETTTTATGLSNNTADDPAPQNGSEASTVNPALLNALLMQMAIMNANRQQAATATTAPAAVVPTATEAEDREGIEYIMGQVNKIIESVARGNISGIVENSLRIQAPASVQLIITNILNYLNGITGGIFGIGTATPSPRSSNNTCLASPAPPMPPSPAAAAGTVG